MSRLSSVLVLLLFPALAFGQTITGANSSTIATGQVITITGSSFGTRPTQTPWIWDNAEDKSNGQSTADGGWAWVEDGGDNPKRPTYSNYNTRTGSSMSFEVVYRTEPDGGWTNSFAKADYTNTLNEIYVDVWCYFTDISPELRQQKWIRTQVNGAGGLPNFYPGNQCTGWNGQMTFSFEGSGPDYDDGHVDTHFYRPRWEGRWFHLQYYNKMGTAGVNNGELKVWGDGELMYHVTDIENRGPGYTNNLGIICFGYFISRSFYVNCVEGTPNQGEFTVYYDDIYVDNRSRARVEIGNVATYNSCTHREIQPMTAWADGAISFTANTGSFAQNDEVYLFVVDGDGNISTGYGPLTVSTDTPPADTTPPAAPTGLTATGGVEQIALTWNANGEGDLAGYIVSRSTTTGAPYTEIPGTITGTSYTDTAVSVGTTYYYAIQAVDTSLNRSEYSTEDSAAPSGGTVTIKNPYNINATAIGE